METCVGCGRHRGNPCGECLELLDGDIVVRRSLVLEIAAIVLFGLPAAGTFWLYLDSLEWMEAGAWRILEMTVLLLLPAAWAVHNLTKPFRYVLDREALFVQRVLGAAERIEIVGLESNLGHVVDLRRNRRFRVGEAKFPGAERFHRALRVRRARVSGVPTT